MAAPRILFWDVHAALAAAPRSRRSAPADRLTADAVSDWLNKACGEILPNRLTLDLSVRLEPEDRAAPAQASLSPNDECRTAESLLRRLEEEVLDHPDAPICLVLNGVTQAKDFFRLKLSSSKLSGDPVSGLGSHLVTRFPDVWPIFIVDREKQRDELVKFLVQEAASSLIEAGQDSLDAIRHLNSHINTIIASHFVSKTAFNDTRPRRIRVWNAFDYFALHLSCQFDPTGLRTLVKLHMWHDVLRGAGARRAGLAVSQPIRPLALLAERFTNTAAVVSDDLSFSLTSALGLYRAGRRVWRIQEDDDFRTGVWRRDTGWRIDADGLEPNGSAVLVHDNNTVWEDPSAKPSSTRVAQSADPSAWEQHASKLLFSSDRDRTSDKFVIRPPLTSSYFLAEDHADTIRNRAIPAAGAGDCEPGGADAPYLLLRFLQAPFPPGAADAIAQIGQPLTHDIPSVLIRRAERLPEDTVEQVTRKAVLLNEALEITLGANASRFVVAFEALQACEARLEAITTGLFSAVLSLDSRRNEIEAVLASTVFGRHATRADNEAFFGSGLHVWTRLQNVYYSGGAVSASLQAQIEALAYFQRLRRGAQDRGRASPAFIQCLSNLFSFAPIRLMRFWLWLLAPAQWPLLFLRTDQRESWAKAQNCCSGGGESAPRRARRRAMLSFQELAAKRDAFRLLSMPWEFVSFYLRFVVFWCASNSALHFAASAGFSAEHKRDFDLPSALYGSVEAGFATFVSAISVSMGPESPFDQLSPMDIIYDAIQFIFIGSNFVFVTLLIAVIVKFVLRE